MTVEYPDWGCFAGQQPSSTWSSRVFRLSAAERIAQLPNTAGCTNINTCSKEHYVPQYVPQEECMPLCGRGTMGQSAPKRPGEPKSHLLDRMRDSIRLKHLSYRTEEAYRNWAKRFIVFHDTRHPQDMGADEIRAFLTPLAVHDKVAASTQNGALNALLFLYRHVLRHPFPDLGEIERATRPRRVPAVLTQEEVQQVLAYLSGVPSLMARLLSGAGLRLMECVRRRVKELDVASRHMTVRNGKGAQDRVTIA
jgi:integrase